MALLPIGLQTQVGGGGDRFGGFYMSVEIDGDTPDVALAGSVGAELEEVDVGASLDGDATATTDGASEAEPDC